MLPNILELVNQLELAIKQNANKGDLEDKIAEIRQNLQTALSYLGVAPPLEM